MGIVGSIDTEQRKQGDGVFCAMHAEAIRRPAGQAGGACGECSDRSETDDFLVGSEFWPG
jgi:hypothetical protein